MNSIWAFETWSDFFQMGHHGFYVWSAYGISFGLVAALVVVSWAQSRRWQLQAQRQLSRQKLQAQHDAQKKKDDRGLQE